MVHIMPHKNDILLAKSRDRVAFVGVHNLNDLPVAEVGPAAAQVMFCGRPQLRMICPWLKEDRCCTGTWQVLQIGMRDLPSSAPYVKTSSRFGTNKYIIYGVSWRLAPTDIADVQVRSR
jgi:hypothetical protein